MAVNGGARSALWRQILCDALGVPLAYLPDGMGAPRVPRSWPASAWARFADVAAAKAWRGRLVRHVPDPDAPRRTPPCSRSELALYPALRRVA